MTSTRRGSISVPRSASRCRRFHPLKYVNGLRRRSGGAVGSIADDAHVVSIRGGRGGGGRARQRRTVTARDVVVASTAPSTRCSRTHQDRAIPHGPWWPCGAAPSRRWWGHRRTVPLRALGAGPERGRGVRHRRRRGPPRAASGGFPTRATRRWSALGARAVSKLGSVAWHLVGAGDGRSTPSGTSARARARSTSGRSPATAATAHQRDAWARIVANGIPGPRTPGPRPSTPAALPRATSPVGEGADQRRGPVRPAARRDVRRRGHRPGSGAVLTTG